MADLFSLIRLRKHTVEEKQKILSQLYREVEVLQKKRVDMEAQLLREKELAAQNGDAGAFFGLYAENMRRKIGMMDAAIKKINVRIDSAQEEVRVAFAEQKKIEIIQERRDQEAARALAEKEADLMDDIALDSFRRRETEQ